MTYVDKNGGDGAQRLLGLEPAASRYVESNIHISEHFGCRPLMCWCVDYILHLSMGDKKAVRYKLVAPFALFRQLMSYGAFREHDVTIASTEPIYGRAAIKGAAEHSVTLSFRAPIWCSQARTWARVALVTCRRTARRIASFLYTFPLKILW